MTAAKNGKKNRPNFFIALELAPDAPWDEREFRRALGAAKNRWTKEARGIQSLPRTASAKELLGLAPHIERVMLNEEEREQERQQARQQQAAKRATQSKEFKERLKLLARRGHLLDAEVTTLRRDYAEILAADTALARRLDAVPVRPAASSPAEPRLDPGKERQLGEQLAIAGLVSIYDALKLADPAVTDQSARKVLLDAADQLYKDQHAKKNRQDPTIKARERLAGLAKEFFRTDEQRARLDASMRSTTLHELAERYLSVLGTAREATSGQVEMFLEEARTKGVDDLGHALAYLREQFAKRGWAIELPTVEAGERLRRLLTCPRCAGLNEPESETCAICAFPLREPCPSCGEVEPRYGGGCRCGFPIGQRELVEELIVRASEALDASSPVQAEARLQRAERIWRLPPDSPDPVAVRLRAAQARLTASAQEIERARITIESMMKARRFIAASDELRTAPEGVPGRRTMLERATTIVREAREVYELGCRATTKARRIELFSEALRLCDDLEAARTELARIPPDPPRNVRATVTDPAQGVLVTWDRPSDPGVSYVVVRQDGTDPPESTEDLPGQPRIGEVADSPMRDRSATEAAGVPLTYAVFAKRFGTLSAPGVAATVTVALDAELRAQAGDGHVVLTWELPPHAVRIELTRREVGGSDAPLTLSAAEPSRLVDTGVRNGVRYRYEAKVAYPGADGAVHWSTGRSVQVTPTRPPEPPGPLVLTRSSAQYGLYAHKVDIRFPVPGRGEVIIVRQDGAGSLREGDQGPHGTLKLDGDIFSGRPPLSHVFIDEAPELVSYVPVLHLDGMDYVGRPRRYAIRDEVAELRGEFAGASVGLGWSWPDGGVRALVGHRTGGEVLDATAVDRPLTVFRVPGEEIGGCMIPVPVEETGVDVVVALVVQKDGLDFVTAGVRRHLARPRVRVEYRIRGAGGRRPSLLLRVAEPADLPTLMLRTRPDRPPYAREEGQLVATVGPLHVRDQHSIALPRSTGQNPHYRLFTAAPGLASTVDLAPA